ncbi:gene transfer agent protein [Roseovarius atlanticus]|uniref:Gene transfer agent protein n=1 Tax=Roseovarius atlanticus TaxID=1641875 RepID=A0A0T5NSY0_9RHOB|nr:head-tail connector protein [Roseovarius atlanticus]KRS12045.1 gene transfer agent protein [Roseovarius atlanticus]
MMLIEETAVPLAALPVDELKAHLRLGSGFSDGDVQDVVLESYLRAAISAIEARTGNILIERDFSWTLTRWRDAGGQALPVAPVSAVNALSLRNRAEDQELIDPASYRLELDAQRPVLRPRSSRLPAIPNGGVAEISFTAGYSQTWGGLPSDLGHAVTLLAAHYYENRNESGAGDRAMPFGVHSLIERYRTVRIFGGGAAG